MRARPVRVLHNGKRHEVGASEQRTVAPPFVASGALRRLPIGMSLAAHMAWTVRLVPCFGLLLDCLLDATFIVDNDIFLTLLILLLRLGNVGEGATLELFSTHLGECLVREAPSSFH